MSLKSSASSLAMSRHYEEQILVLEQKCQNVEKLLENCLDQRDLCLKRLKVEDKEKVDMIIESKKM